MKQILKTCTRCNIAKPHSEFHKDGSKRNGLYARCKPCNLAAKKAALQHPDTREAILASAKRTTAKRYIQFRADLDKIKDVPCVDCGMRFPPCAMHFDHLDPKEKAFNIGNAVTRDWNVVLAEIAKTNIVCVVCHRLREHKRRETVRGDKPLDYRTIEFRTIVWPLKNKPCEHCGETFHPIAMDFDHIDHETKLFAISNYNHHHCIEDIPAEIAKCRLLCACCHAIKTHAGRETMNRKRQ